MVWKYGWGHYDAQKRAVAFTPLPRFAAGQYCGAAGPPDPKIGWVLLTQTGGHPGDRQHQAIRRWIAPRGGTVRIESTLEHTQPKPMCGNGVEAWIVSSRSDQLGHWMSDNTKVAARVESVTIEKGDTIDFIVDSRGTVDCDTFNWAPVIRLNPPSRPLADAATVKVVAAKPSAASNEGAVQWDAAADFAPPAQSAAPVLTPWEEYAQVLLMTDEFVFVD